MRFVLLLIAFALTSCRDRAEGPPPPVPVEVASAVRKDVPVTVQSIGMIEASLSAAVVPQVTGILREVHFAEGAHVKEGDLLFVIDPAPYDAELKQAEAQLARVQAEARSAELKKQRYSPLVGKDFVSKQQFDEVISESQAAAAAVSAAEAAVEKAKLDVNYCRISSPISGLAGDLLIKAGNLVRANDAQSTLVRINELRPVYARFTLPESYLNSVLERRAASMLRATVSDPAGTAAPASGELTFLDNAVDRTTGTFLLKASLPNEDERYYPGQFVNVSLELEKHLHALTVPNEAVLNGQAGAYVFVLGADGKVSHQPVKTGVSTAKDTEILSGVDEGQLVVTDGHVRLADGTPAQERRR